MSKPMPLEVVAANRLDDSVIALTDHLDYPGVLRLLAAVLRFRLTRPTIETTAAVANLEDVTESLERSSLERSASST